MTNKLSAKTNKLTNEHSSVIIISVVVTLKISPPRFDILDSGALQISSLRQRDSGLYTCTARNDNGETHWAATLTIIGKRLVCNIRKLIWGPGGVLSTKVVIGMCRKHG